MFVADNFCFAIELVSNSAHDAIESSSRIAPATYDPFELAVGRFALFTTKEYSFTNSTMATKAVAANPPTANLFARATAKSEASVVNVPDRTLDSATIREAG